MITTLIIKILVYILWFPLFIGISKGLIRFMKFQFRRKMRIRPQRDNRKEVKQSFTSKLMQGVKFELKGDKRPLFKKGGPSRTITFWAFMIIGLGMTIASCFMKGNLFLISLLFPVLGTFYAYGISKSMISEQENIKQRLYDTKKDAMGLVDRTSEQSFDSEFKILKWAPDRKSFNKVLLYIPTSFDQLNSQYVIDKFNQNFGGDTAWVADVDSDTHGWDFVRGMVTLKRTPALPKLAPWDAHYVLDDRVAWSFFPIGLGVENGVSIINPKTKKEEHVLGFDLQGIEGKLGKKKKFDVGSEIVAAPQVLIAGGTGGGKSLSENTIVPIVTTDKRDKKFKK